MTTEQAQPAAPDAVEARPRRSPLRPILLLVAAVVVIDVLALLFAPPFDPSPPAGQVGCPFPACFINGNLELPPPATVIDFDAAHPLVNGGLVIAFHPSISSTLLTMWLVMAALLLFGFVATRRLRAIPGPLQNFVEWGYETMESFARSTGGPEAIRHVPVFASFFVLILFCNWSGLLSPIGKVQQLRAPTSDVNVTIGLALVAFVYFEYQGFRALGIGYLGKFFPIGEFRNGLGAGLIAMFVGLIELMLEFVKLVTLSMRLFGNIYGGEVALGVVTALTIAVVPALIVGLEAMLNFVQALIFSTLTLMFTLIAIESHEEEHAVHDAAHDAALTAEGDNHSLAPSPAG